MDSLLGVRRVKKSARLAGGSSKRLFSQIWAAQLGLSVFLISMAVTIEGFSVVAQAQRIQRLLDDGSVKAPNSTGLSDSHLWKCCFMAKADAEKFLRTLGELGLNVSQGPDSDVVLATEFDRSVEPGNGSAGLAGSGRVASR